MSTPLSRARVALRAVHRFKAGIADRDVEANDPEAAAAATDVGSFSGWLLASDFPR